MNPQDYLGDGNYASGNIQQTKVTNGFKLTPAEHAAYTIGHEANGHINKGLTGITVHENMANYYGFKAVKAYREYMKNE